MITPTEICNENNIKPKLPSCKFDSLSKKNLENAKFRMKRNLQDLLTSSQDFWHNMFEIETL